MSLFGRNRRIEDLERQVSRLRAALTQNSEVAGRWTTYRREVTWAIAAFILAFGFTLGVYREPIQEVVIGLAQTLGIARGNSDAAYDAYQEGRYGTALRLARPLAAQGDARAQSVLGLLYYRGFGGVTQDDAAAMKWFRNAADRGDARAQYHLGLFYANGDSGETDNVSAHMWFNLASARFPASDISFRSAARMNRDLVAEKMTPYQIAEAQKLAREWKPKSN
jgi:TPR repeat protein